MLDPAQPASQARHLFVLTGASRGLGLALARQLLAPQHTLLTMSRQAGGVLAAAAARVPGAHWLDWSADLADAAPAAARLGAWLRAQPPDRYASASLINNAAVMPPIVPLRAAQAHDLAQALQVGLVAPLQLTAAFLDGTRTWLGVRKVLNVSSGLGRRPMASQAAYCAAKAGLDHATRCLALEEAMQPHGARVCSLAPGVIDTDMQVQLRDADAAAFPDRARFEQLQRSGALTDPAAAARSVLDWLAQPAFGTQAVADVRQP